MHRRAILLIAMVLALAYNPTIISAALSPEEIAHLGNDLTPLGAERAGNEAGTIPPWEGGITTPPAGYKPGDHHPDPYADDKVLFTITEASIDTYKDKLTAGQKAILKAYKTFHMNVYPTRRSASATKRIYDATRQVAATAELAEGGNGVVNAVIGYPFPIPKSGLEVIWNHIVRWRGNAVQRYIQMAPVTRGGDYTMVQLLENVDLPYSHEGMTEEKLDNVMFKFQRTTLAPANLAGQITLIHETMNQAKEDRKAWQYHPGERRVRRAPTVAFDTPQDGADGLVTYDVADMYNGSPERYDWELIGKKEMYVPYNSYKLHSDSLKYKDILKPLHLNPEHLRYELHRVWVVEATLKEGAKHIYKRRTFYVDEDSWQILAMDQYNNENKLWRVSEGHPLNFYEVQVFYPTVEVHYDLESGRYLAYGLYNEGKVADFSVKFDANDFSPAALRRAGRR